MCCVLWCVAAELEPVLLVQQGVVTEYLSKGKGRRLSSSKEHRTPSGMSSGGGGGGGGSGSGGGGGGGGGGSSSSSSARKRPREDASDVPEFLESDNCRKVDIYEKLNRIGEGTYGGSSRCVSAQRRVTTVPCWFAIRRHGVSR